jgi:anion transporter
VSDAAEHPGEGGARRRIGGAILGVAIASAVWLAPIPGGLTSVGHSILAILALTVTFWVFEVLISAVTSLLMLALMIVAGVRPEHALSAFSGQAFWILLVVLFYGYAMQSTGLAKRLSFVILSWFPPTYAGILASFFVIGLMLSLGVPSITVRTAILAPIAWALVEALGLPPRSRESSLIVISTVEMAMVPGCATLLGSLWGPLMIQLFRAQGYDLQWTMWARAMTLPTIVWCVLLLVGNWVVLRPERELTGGRAFAKSQLAALGAMSRHEKTTAAVVLLSMCYWVTQDRLHHFPTYVVGMFALVAFAASGILREQDFGRAVPWSLLLFLGAVFSLPEIIQQNHVSEWVAGLVVPIVQAVSASTLALAVVLCAAMLLLRFTDPTGFMIMTVLFLPISSILRGASISPIVLIASLLIGGHPFWTLYENYWMALAGGLTGGQGFSDTHRVRLAHVYGTTSLLAVAIAVAYWRAIGLWR